MLPFLFQLPSKVLVVGALLLALTLGGRALRARDGGWSFGAAVATLLTAAVLARIYGGQWLPTLDGLVSRWPAVLVNSYVAMLGLAFVLGWALARGLGARDGIAPALIDHLCATACLGSLVGAWALGAVVRLSSEGWGAAGLLAPVGLVAYGGMAGGVLAGLWRCRRHGVPFLRWADAAAPSVAFGTAVTRLGCFAYGCDFGTRSLLPWAVRFPAGRPAWHEHVERFGLSREAAASFPVHPAQLYEALGAALIGLYLVLTCRSRRFEGESFARWAVGYGSLRILVEFLRGDPDRGSLGPLSTSQAISLVVIAGGLVLLWRGRHGTKGGINGAALKKRESE